MSKLLEHWRRLRMFLARPRLERELAEEMRLHLELRERELRKSGLDPVAARRAARLGFGNQTLHAEDSRASWGWRRLDELSADARYALRAMRRTPGFTAIAVLALALGIGANTAILSVVDAVLLRPLAYRDADRLVTVLSAGERPVAPRNFLDWREQARSFSAMGAAEAFGPNLAGVERPEQVSGLRLTSDVFPMLGVKPLLGRFPVDADGDHVVVLGHGLWTRRFGADPAVVGRELRLDGQSYSVVGVMPRGFRFAPFWVTDAEVWSPLVFGEHADSRTRNSLRVFARLADGVELDAARAELAGITGRLEAEFPGTNRDITITPLKEKVVGGVRAALLVLLGAVGFVLLIACANIAHMLLARASARQREIAIRIALGAGRRRLLQQFVTESVILALLGAAFGVVLASLAIDGLVALHPGDVPRVLDVSLDGRVLAIMFGVTLTAGLAFGLLPALQHESMPRRGRRLRGLLVASQVALSLVLTVGAGLMIRSFLSLRAIDGGWNPRDVVAMKVSVAGTQQSDPVRRAALFRSLVDDVAAVPGVRSASAINHLPLAGDIWGMSIYIEGQPMPKPGEGPVATYRVVLPGYFATMQQTLVRGRDLAATDTLDAPPVVIVNQRLAELHFPGEDAVGKRISLDDPLAGPWVTIVGVAADARQNNWAETPGAEVYFPYLQTRSYLESSASPFAYLTLVARTHIDAASLASTVRERVRAVDPGITVSQVTTMEEAVAQANARPRFLLLVLGAFAAASLLLSAIGIYGVVSHSVARRRQEIGIRVALGATRGDVLRLVLREGLGSVLAGVGVGLLGALALSRLMQGILHGVGATDPPTFLAVAALLVGVAALACLVPARRAARVDPMIALRQD